ncbi:G2/M phase-specific E3 ubiquitin-protein ligase-like [Neopsephotus bourkii]|uniref:G2/M phase-specific E3 ubiquitin-protein ligase-like n=1 Tax=Neopsephotus bourkii TaxID=309878 RepID=UPI002AA5AA6F|nr:G2/M phase-specific E3 ubiquitin-protein ligase-like [Neopsephotus bourkii]
MIFHSDVDSEAEVDETLKKDASLGNTHEKLFASELAREDTEQEAEMRFYRADVQRTVEQAAQMGLLCSFQVCFVCGKGGATITCQETGCGRRFHLPCAVEGQCVTCYLPPFRSFCQEHRPQQQELVAPENTKCLICMDPVEGRTTYGTMVCPACKHAWFHRACIQGQALCAGILCLQCPLCRNQNWFFLEMMHMGIQIPIRLVSSCLALCHAWPCTSSRGPLLSPLSLGFSSMEELETGCGEKSGEAVHVPDAGAAAGAHQFSFLHQTSVMGGQQCIRRTLPEAQEL